MKGVGCVCVREKQKGRDAGPLTQMVRDIQTTAAEIPCAQIWPKHDDKRLHGAVLHDSVLHYYIITQISAIRRLLCVDFSAIETIQT